MSITSELHPNVIVIVDDHEAVLAGTLSLLEKEYPETEFLTAQDAQSAKATIEQGQPDLAVMDLSIPTTAKTPAQTEVGIQLLRSLMTAYPELNLVVQSAHVRSLVRLKPAIEMHRGGFTISDKSAPMREMLTKVEWALQGLVYTPPEMRVKLEVKPQWLEVLQLAFQEGLQDKTIAEKMCISERTVRHYWTRVQDALGVYPDEGKNMRIQTEIRARQEGLLD
ncbi:response regulator transcription factor [Leptolyngbya cf. ectocarpi LEGE 11479]|uniref:Response regulator transcription factor n=1 Tax=Leptolyngbya cf. ectocarpi LEGE 11479 TaxID=1828722 RepID=A0A928X3M5_LEPEC|nr:response regulator transcription factor [Leptolyngbya ectocarpi]MBE9066994.1 response regulator transcription factor [Leptolyngbya cf. ectocarpi LEGE 11479]